MNSCKGFSLIELLISLIIISLITMVFAPIMTKKMKNDKIALKLKENSKGVQVFSNPGKYVFDVPKGVEKIYISAAAGGGGGAGARITTKTYTFSTSQNWTIPTGVTKIKVKITGAGGGGGGGYASNEYHSCAQGYSTYSGFADNGQDLCIGEPQHRNANVIYLTNISADQTPAPSVCWDGIYPTGYRYLLCTYTAAVFACRDDITRFSNDAKNGVNGRVRQLTRNELYRLIQKDRLGSTGLKMCSQGGTKYPPLCGTVAPGCISGQTYECSPYAIWGQQDEQNATGFLGIFIDNDKIYTNDTDGFLGIYYQGYANYAASQVRCAYIRNNWRQYSGAGGNSGAVYERSIPVEAGKTLNITIGKGGKGGKAGESGENGTDTTVVYNSLKFGVKGATGGKGASAASNGGINSIGNLCYSHTAEVSCTSNSQRGEYGASLKGGAGAVVKGVEHSDNDIAQGGELPFEFENIPQTSIGKNASKFGFGGGGGTCGRAVRSASACSNGGAGANGLVEISYDVVLPAGAGGAGAAIGVDKNGVNYEIEYKTTPGEQIVLEVGQGGQGGDVEQDGTDGTQTTIMRNHIIFNPGKAGKTIGSGGLGGNMVIRSSNVKIKNISTITSDIAKGSNGSMAKTLSSKYPALATGLDGGIGGTTYLNYQGGCGGGTFNDGCSYSNTADGQDAKYYDAINNSNGGAGGGGGGASRTSGPGRGGNGSDGFIRIRWGEE